MSDEEGSIYTAAQLRRRKIVAWVALSVMFLVVGGGSALVFWMLTR